MATVTLPSEIGNTVTLSTSLVTYDNSGNSTPATGTVTCTVSAPDGTTLTPAVTASGTSGTYIAQFTPTLAGVWRYRFDAVLAGGLAASDGGSFTLRPDVLTAAPVTLSETKAHLNYRGSDVRDDAELARFLDAAVQMAEWYCGPVVPQTVTENHDGGKISIYLRKPPVISVTSISEILALTTYNLTNQPPGATTGAYGYSLDDPRTGRVTRRGGGGNAFPFMRGNNNIVVTYQAGYPVIPSLLRLGILELVRYWWIHSQEAAVQGSQDTYDMTVTAEFDGLPNAVKNKWEPFRRLAVFA